MGKFPQADEALSKIWVCRKCKARNKAGALQQGPLSREQIEREHTRWRRPLQEERSAQGF